jgi:peptidoglycan hydrolase-like protein with peptidoglycan-binding domain
VQPANPVIEPSAAAVAPTDFRAGATTVAATAATVQPATPVIEPSAAAVAPIDFRAGATTVAATAATVQPATPVIEPSAAAVAPTDFHAGATAAPAVVQSVPERELTWEEVHEVQIKLRDLKIDPGPIDGVKGPLTSAAVRRFQEARGQRGTGDIGLNTLTQLREAAARND